mmetsp:Transcript_18604/g.38911  ORF Transcript_18604/g.38911 Transcript_18604/m.38911 type:complete len:168 (+) Transcript_18604:86-589(+)
MCTDVLEGFVMDGDGHCFLLMCHNTSIHPRPFGVVACRLDPFLPQGDDASHRLRNKILCWDEDVCGDLLPPTLLFRPEWLVAGLPIQKIDAAAFDEAAAATMDTDVSLAIQQPAPADSTIANKHTSTKQKKSKDTTKPTSSPPKKAPPKITLPIAIYLPVTLAAPLL